MRWLGVLTGRNVAALWLAFVVSLGIGSDFIANDVPLATHLEDRTYYPAFEEAWTGRTRLPAPPPLADSPADWEIWPPIPYNGSDSDLSITGYTPPLASTVAGPRGVHLLGTDALGRDVAAALVHGAGVATKVGIGATLIALVIGIILGGAAGFFGNDGLRVERATWVALIVGGGTGAIYGLLCLIPFFGVTEGGSTVMVCLLFTAVPAIFIYLILCRFAFFRCRVPLPADTIVLQLVEVFTGIPGLVLLIATTALIATPSVWTIAIIIGLLGWPRVVRYLRAELIRIRALPYIKAAYGSGVSRWRALWRHALPNALGPIMVLAAFMVGGAILLEAFLSFLGLGLPLNDPTWGSLLRRARERPEAWWLALFPGLMLTFTLLALQVLVDRQRWVRQ